MGAERLPFESIYGAIPGNPTSPRLLTAPPSSELEKVAPFCNVSSAALGRIRTGCLAGEGGACPEGRAGAFCEGSKRSYCLRDCSNRGWCDAGFCWCRRGWFGIDCSQSTRGLAPSLQSRQQLPSPAASAAAELRVYVYDMPSEFTTRNLQWRTGSTEGLHRFIRPSDNVSEFTQGSLYAMESALHEWLLDSPLRTTEPSEAHLFFVPIYAASIFMYPIVKYAEQPYYGADEDA
jgi:hypothetical protein